ncbi:flotillin family protein [Chryseolinea sp. T2]|uniref:flotillin family protein n=1 Tax=Chryseolinea sp. T2 TaxID=3129255 RepID=UPI0030785E56
MDVLGGIGLLLIGGIVFFFFIILFAFASFYKKIPHGKAIVRTGVGGGKVAFNKGMYVIPVLHRMEIMDISVKKLQIDRLEQEGLICKDNIRADIKVAFFVRINRSVDDVLNVAQIIGTERASDVDTLRNLFEAKFSEALKTVGKKFDFVELYEARREFRTEILNIIGTDLNGYILDDCAIDYLEQTEIKFLSAQNILDSQGIKKITELTAEQNVKANLIKRDEEKIIKKQNVEAREAILELDRQMAEKEEKQFREIENIRSRERAEIAKVKEEERLRAETVRIKTDESLAVQEENKLRQIIIAEKNKQRTNAVETERVEKDRALEATEREKIVTLAQIEKEKILEVERKNIQDVIRDRVRLEKGVVEEQQGVKDLQAFREVERNKTVNLTLAAQQAEEKLIHTVKAAEAEKKAAEEKAKQMIIDADAKKEAAVKQAEARKILAEAQAREEATIGLSEAEVLMAKADAAERQGIVDATVIEKVAEAKRKEGLTQAEVTKEKALAEAAGIQEKAEAMKKLDTVGKDHEEFKLLLAKERDIQLAQINIQKDIAASQAAILGEALKSARIDIVGGETMFFNNIVNQISNAKGFDRLINESENATQLKTALLGDGENSGDLLDRIKGFAEKYNITSNDIKNLTISSLILKMQQKSSDEDRPSLLSLANLATSLGLANKKL